MIPKELLDECDDIQRRNDDATPAPALAQPTTPPTDTDAISSHAANPFAVMLLQRIRLATAEYRKSRDELKVAMIALQNKSQADALKPVDIPPNKSRK